MQPRNVCEVRAVAIYIGAHREGCDPCASDPVDIGSRNAPLHDPDEKFCTSNKTLLPRRGCP